MKDELTINQNYVLRTGLDDQYSLYVFERKINLLERIHNTHGIEFVDYDISFKGICPKCREKTGMLSKYSS